MTHLDLRAFLCAGVLALTACSEDIPAGDPGGMGAEDLSPPARAVEAGGEPAAEVLEQVNTPEFADTTDASGEGMTAAQRDSAGRVP